MLKHGEWGKWLEESVSYSQNTAERLMKLYEEYGSSFSDRSGMSNSAPVQNLSYTQALLLLGLPAEEREEFLVQNDVTGMTKQELQQVLKDRDQAKQAQEQTLQENQVLKKGLKLIDSTLSELKKVQAKDPVQLDPENIPGEASADSAAPSVSNIPTTNNPPLPTHNLQTEPDPNAAAKYVERCDTCRKTINAAPYRCQGYKGSSPQPAMTLKKGQVAH